MLYPNNSCHALGPMLQEDGFAVSERPVAGSAAVVIHTDSQLETSTAKLARATLGPRGRVLVACPACHVVSSWSLLRHVGLEPKKTVFIHLENGEPAQSAVIVAQVAKRGGLVVELSRRSF